MYELLLQLAEASTKVSGPVCAPVLPQLAEASTLALRPCEIFVSRFLLLLLLLLF